MWSNWKKSRLAPLLSVLLACCVCLPPGQAAPGPVRERIVDVGPRPAITRPVADKWALVIGISNFKDPNVKLKYATKDATDFYDYLIHTARFAPDHVKILTDENATRERILDELGDKWLPHVALPDDLVTIYISTHGSPSSVDSGGVNYLVAYNTDPNRLYSTGIPIQDLTRLIKDRVHSDRIVVIMDACHSGAAQAGGKALNRDLNMDASQLSQGTGQLVICSSEPSQSSWESQRYANGVFTRQLIECLKQKPVLGDAFDAMRVQVADEVARDRGELQQPVLKSAWSGNQIVLSARASAPRPGLKELEDYAPNARSASIPSTPPTQTPITARPLQTAQPSAEKEAQSLPARPVRQPQASPQVAMLPTRTPTVVPRSVVPPQAVPSTIWDSYIQQGRKAYFSGRMEDAERLFKTAAKEAEKFSQRDPRVAKGMELMAMVDVYQNKLADAETLLKNAITLDEGLPASQQRQLGSHLEHLAWVYYLDGKYDNAEPLLQRALAIWETQLGQEQAKVADCLCALGRLYRAQGKLPESETMLTRALTIARDALGEDDPAVAQVMCDLGYTLCLEGNYKEAEPLLKSTIAIWQQTPGSQHPLVAVAYLRLGDVYTGLGKTSPAEVNYRKALAIAEKAGITFLPGLPESLTNLQHLFETQHKQPKAVEWQHFVSQLGHNSMTPAEFDYSIERTRQDLRVPPTPENFPAWTVDESLGTGQTREGKWVWNKARQQFDVLWSTGDREVLQLQKFDNNEVTLLGNGLKYIGLRKAGGIDGTASSMYLKQGQSISSMVAPKTGFTVLRAGESGAEVEEPNEKLSSSKVSHTTGRAHTWKATW